MAAIRNIIGHISVEVAKKKRACQRNSKEHSISKGEPCLVIKGGSYNAGKSYCCICAKPILKLAENRLSEIQKEMGIKFGEA